MILLATLHGCYGLRSSQGGGEIEGVSRKINSSDIALPRGYSIDAVATDLTFPTGITFDEDGEVYIIESGYSYGETWTEPRLLKLQGSGGPDVIAMGQKNGPWNGVTFYNGSFFVAEGGAMNGGKILKIEKSGNVVNLIENLPGKGDHHTNGPVVMDGYIYFGQGTATNSAIVGEDNANL